MFVKKSCEDPDTIYICLFGRRLIIRKNLKHPFNGWYNPKLKKVI